MRPHRFNIHNSLQNAGTSSLASFFEWRFQIPTTRQSFEISNHQKQWQTSIIPDSFGIGHKTPASKRPWKIMYVFISSLHNIREQVIFLPFARTDHKYIRKDPLGLQRLEIFNQPCKLVISFFPHLRLLCNRPVRTCRGRGTLDPK